MLRKTVTILSLIGLLLSVGAWAWSLGVQRVPRHWDSTHEGWGLGIHSGNIDIFRVPLERIPSGRGVVFDISIHISIVVFGFLILLACTLLPGARRIVALIVISSALLSLLLSLGLWIWSYFGYAVAVWERYQVTLGPGAAMVKRVQDLSRVESNQSRYRSARPGIRFHHTSYQAFTRRLTQTVWWPKYHWGISAVHVEPPTTYFQWTVPFWLPALALAGLLAVWVVPLHRCRKRKKLGLCLKCGYDLRASKDRCPECGEEFVSTNVLC